MSRADLEKDYYGVLGARVDATQSEIERLYRRLAQQRHPDRGGDEEEMKALNEAYCVLKNVSARRAYDAGREGVRARRVNLRDDYQAPPHSSPAAEADMVYGQCARAALCLAVGLALLLLVRFQWIWFLWPLAVLALFVIVLGVWMAHSAMLAVREGFAPEHPAHRFKAAQETLFWSLVCSGGYGVYLILSVV